MFPRYPRMLTCASLAVVVTAVSFFQSPITLAQEAAETAEAAPTDVYAAKVAELSKYNAELNALRTKVREAKGFQRPLLEAELDEQRTRYRRKVGDLVALVTKDGVGDEAAEARKFVTGLLRQSAARIKKDMNAVDDRLAIVVDNLQTNDPRAVDRARGDLHTVLRGGDRLLKELDDNIRNRKLLELDVKSDVEFLKDRLDRRSKIFSGALQLSKKRIARLDRRSQEDPDALEELQFVRESRAVVAQSQRVNVGLMDRYGMDTIQLRRGLISATGELSDDIFDTGVLAGLAEDWYVEGKDWFRVSGPVFVAKTLSFLLIVFLFWILARFAGGLVKRAIKRSRVQLSSLAQEFFTKSAGRVVLVLGILIALSQVGVRITPLLAGLGIAGFVVGFALQDTLANFASGMMILIYRPFDEGDLIEAGGVYGKVQRMTLVSTMILTLDNQLLVVPNNKVWGDVIRNVTHQTNRRVDLTFGIAYSDDIEKAEQVLAAILEDHDKVLKHPEPLVKLHELGESSVNFVVRPWTKTDDYWAVYWDVTREVKRRFDAEGISIPFPQRDLHIYEHNEVEVPESREIRPSHIAPGPKT